MASERSHQREHPGTVPTANRFTGVDKTTNP